MLGVLLAALLITAAHALEIHFIDVGQGDAVLIRSPGGQNVLYDGGRPAGSVLHYLREQGVPTLDLVIASHADADHIGGLAAVVETYRPRFFMDNGIEHTTATYLELLGAVGKAGSAYLEPSARTIGLGEARLHVLPTLGDAAAGQNANSIGIVVEYGDFRALLAGDADERAFRGWYEEWPELLENVQVYKASHHGSLNGDTRWTLRRLAPHTIVVSVGAGNTYGHPAAEVHRLYEEVALAILRTDLHGHIVVQAQPTAAFATRHDNAEAPVLQFTSRTLLPSGAMPAQGEAPVIIECILFNPPGADDGSETVTLLATEDADVSGWILADAANHTFRLPRRELAAGERIELRNTGKPVWNNDGDTAYLIDARGTLVDEFSYSGRGSLACR